MAGGLWNSAARRDGVCRPAQTAAKPLGSVGGRALSCSGDAAAVVRHRSRGRRTGSAAGLARRATARADRRLRTVFRSHRSLDFELFGRPSARPSRAPRRALRALANPDAGRLRVVRYRAGGALMAGGALVTTGLTSSDIYLYVGHGRLGLGAYAPPPTRFPGEFGAINDLRESRSIRCFTAPLLAVESAVNLFVHGLTGALLTYRISAWRSSARASRLSPRCANPRDRRDIRVEPGLLRTIRRRRPQRRLAAGADSRGDPGHAAQSWLGFVLIAAAGATKLPFAFAGLVAFDALTSRAKRVALAAVAVLSPWPPPLGAAVGSTSRLRPACRHESSATPS